MNCLPRCASMRVLQAAAGTDHLAAGAQQLAVKVNLQKTNGLPRKQERLSYVAVLQPVSVVLALTDSHLHVPENVTDPVLVSDKT